MIISRGRDLALALRSAYLALHRRSDAAFAEYCVTADQFVLLSALARGGRAVSQRELAERMSSDPNTVRAMLLILERRGFVERGTHPTDARARTASLTQAGKAMFDLLWTAGEPVRACLLNGLSVDETESLIELLKRLSGSLNDDLVALDASPDHSLHGESCAND